MAWRCSAARLYQPLGVVPIVAYHEYRAVEMRADRLVL